jgi:hypothetical protein
MTWVCAVCKRSNEGLAASCSVCASARAYAPRDKSPLRQLPPPLAAAAAAADQGSGSSAGSGAKSSSANKDAVAALMASHGHTRKAF